MVISNIEGKICFVLRMLLHAGCQQCCLIDLITGGLISKPKRKAGSSPYVGKPCPSVCFAALPLDQIQL
jgi:hypothetical protein